MIDKELNKDNLIAFGNAFYNGYSDAIKTMPKKQAMAYAKEMAYDAYPYARKVLESNSPDGNYDKTLLSGVIGRKVADYNRINGIKSHPKIIQTVDNILVSKEDISRFADSFLDGMRIALSQGYNKNAARGYGIKYMCNAHSIAHKILSDRKWRKRSSENKKLFLSLSASIGARIRRIGDTKQLPMDIGDMQTKQSTGQQFQPDYYSREYFTVDGVEYSKVCKGNGVYYYRGGDYIGKKDKFDAFIRRSKANGGLTQFQIDVKNTIDEYNENAYKSILDCATTMLYLPQDDIVTALVGGNPGLPGKIRETLKDRYDIISLKHGYTFSPRDPRERELSRLQNDMQSIMAKIEELKKSTTK